MDSENAATGPTAKTDERGTILIAGVLFMVLLLGAATFGVDLSNYFLKTAQTQRVADGAALAGGSALNQYTDHPDVSEAYDAVLGYVRTRQGPEYVELYEVRSDTTVEGIWVVPRVDASGETHYRVGVMAFGSFEPYFLPREVFGDDPRGIVRTAVAQINSIERTRLRDVPLDCGVFADDTIEISGNNFNAANTNFCGNHTIDASGSNNGTMGNVYHYEPFNFHPPHPNGSYKNEYTYTPERALPYFEPSEPGPYDAVISDYQYTREFPSCGGHSRVVLRKSDSQPLEWSNTGRDVCVSRTGAGSFEFPDNNEGLIQHPDGSPVSLYVDGDVTFSGSQGGMNGGLYATGDVRVTQNNNRFLGDPGTMKGLGIWAEGELDIQKNSVTVEGIMGTETDLTFGTMGGGGGPVLRGIVISHGRIDLPANSNNVTFAPTTFDYDAFRSFEDWADPDQQTLDQPLFANISVQLID